MSDLSCSVPVTLDSFQMFEFYERVSGARMHAAYVRPGGVHQVGFSRGHAGDEKNAH